MTFVLEAMQAIASKADKNLLRQLAAVAPAADLHEFCATAAAAAGCRRAPSDFDGQRGEALVADWLDLGCDLIEDMPPSDIFECYSRLSDEARRVVVELVALSDKNDEMSEYVLRLP